MKNTHILQLYYAHGKHVVQVASHRAEELFLHLASQGIESQVHRINGHERSLNWTKMSIWRWCRSS